MSKGAPSLGKGYGKQQQQQARARSSSASAAARKGGTVIGQNNMQNTSNAEDQLKQMMDEFDKITNIEDLLNLKKKIADKVVEVPAGTVCQKQHGHSNDVAKKLRNRETFAAELQVAEDQFKAVHEQDDEDSKNLINTQVQQKHFRGKGA